MTLCAAVAAVQSLIRLADTKNEYTYDPPPWSWKLKSRTPSELIFVSVNLEDDYEKYIGATRILSANTEDANRKRIEKLEANLDFDLKDKFILKLSGEKLDKAVTVTITISYKYRRDTFLPGNHNMYGGWTSDYDLVKDKEIIFP
ncbi:hypothetical protein Pla110_31870 [Polystyrenella longa]|uniref:Uncharacterized protein n=2 Tax=Polystyrenella longa TaxID=2528007 RepID=A0A518CQD7_9PLAN|nr:hypothetical protein Pla110_31870 [Polystyrenella longa]